MSRAGNDNIRAAAITVLGSGYFPFASGTWGSLASALLFAAMWAGLSAFAAPRSLLEAGTAAGVLIASVLSVAWGPWAIARFGRSDPKQFVLDEFAGQWVALLALPVALGASTASIAAAMLGQFLLFRVFDILKPPPARQAERLPAGWGVLTDDLVAGAYANLVGQLIWRMTPLAA